MKQNHDDSYIDYFEHEKTYDFFKKKFLKQHEQERQRIRRYSLNMSSNQVRETQIARHATIALYFRKIETGLNDEFHHKLIILETQRNRIQFDLDDD